MTDLECAHIFILVRNGVKYCYRRTEMLQTPHGSGLKTTSSGQRAFNVEAHMSKQLNVFKNI